VENGQGERSNFVDCDAASLILREALSKLKTASRLISLLIDEELVRLTDGERLERLYSAKGGVTCAIEETEKRLASIDC
jgi:hypothetical protein